jgi:hypothetical protein
MKRMTLGLGRGIDRRPGVVMFVLLGALGLALGGLAITLAIVAGR